MLVGFLWLRQFRTGRDANQLCVIKDKRMEDAVMMPGPLH